MNLKKLLWLCSDDGSRYVINFPFFYEHNGEQFLVTTDGRLLVSMPVPGYVVPFPCAREKPVNAGYILQAIDACNQEDAVPVKLPPCVHAGAVRWTTDIDWEMEGPELEMPFNYRLSSGTVINREFVHKVLVCSDFDKNLTVVSAADNMVVFYSHALRFCIKGMRLTKQEWLWDLVSGGFVLEKGGKS